MIEIQPEHMKAFEAAKLDRFFARAAEHARRNFPKESQRFTDDELRSRFTRQMPASQSYGLRTERQLFCFFDTGLLLGERFDSDAALGWTRTILMDQQKTPDQRATGLLRSAMDARREAEK